MTEKREIEAWAVLQPSGAIGQAISSDELTIYADKEDADHCAAWFEDHCMGERRVVKVRVEVIDE